MMNERTSFDEGERVDFPNYLSQQPVQSVRNDKEQQEIRYNLPDIPRFETNQHQAEEVPTLVRYEDDTAFQETFDQYVAAESFKKYQRQSFQPTILPPPRSGVGPAVIDERDYRPYIDYLTRSTDELIYFEVNEEEEP